MPTHDCDTLEERERAEIAGNEPGAQEEHADALEVLTYLPAGQEAQFVAADALEYLPAMQSLQLPLLATSKPARMHKYPYPSQASTVILMYLADTG